MIAISLIAALSIGNAGKPPDFDGIWYGTKYGMPAVKLDGTNRVTIPVGKKIGLLNIGGRDVGTNNEFVEWGFFSNMLVETDGAITAAGTVPASQRGDGLVEWQMDRPKVNGKPTFLLRLRGQTSGWVLQDQFEYCCGTDQIRASGTYRDQWHKLTIKMTSTAISGSLEYEGMIYKIKNLTTRNGLAFVSFISEKYNERFKDAFLQWNPLPEELRDLMAGKADVNASRIMLFMRTRTGADPYELKLVQD